MNQVKIFGIVLEDGVYKSYELSELEGTGVYVNYVLQCTKVQINTIVKMLNDITKVIK